MCYLSHQLQAAAAFLFIILFILIFLYLTTLLLYLRLFSTFYLTHTRLFFPPSLAVRVSLHFSVKIITVHSVSVCRGIPGWLKPDQFLIMKWHLSKQGNILPVTPERRDVCAKIVCVQARCWMDGCPWVHCKQTDSKLINQSRSQSVMQLFIRFASDSVSWLDSRGMCFCISWMSLSEPHPVHTLNEPICELISQTESQSDDPARSRLAALSVSQSLGLADPLIFQREP